MSVICGMEMDRQSFIVGMHDNIGTSNVSAGEILQWARNEYISVNVYILTSNSCLPVGHRDKSRHNTLIPLQERF